MATFSEQLKKIVVDQLGVDESEVVPDASFIEDLHADSLDMVELVISLEEEFNLRISEEDVEHLSTVGDALAYLSQRLLVVEPLS